MTYDEPPKCPGCRLPEPADWCWEQRMDCPLDKPPKYLDVHMLWRYVRELERGLSSGDPCYGCGTRSRFDPEGSYWYCPHCGVGVDQDGQKILPDGSVGVA